MMKMNKGIFYFTTYSMARVVSFIGCVLLMLTSNLAWGQTPIQEGKFTLADSTVFWVTADEIRNTYWVSDRETYPYITTRRDTMSLETMLIGEYLAKYKLVSDPSLGEICQKAFQKKSSVRFALGKRILSVDVHLNPVSLEIWSVSFLLPKKNNDVTLEDLTAIRHAIHKLYRPKVVSETDFYQQYYDYLSDSDSLYED